jgi:hypothetical protein
VPEISGKRIVGRAEARCRLKACPTVCNTVAIEK